MGTLSGTHFKTHQIIKSLFFAKIMDLNFKLTTKINSKRKDSNIFLENLSPI